ncbi:secretin receptor-like [Ruditapes philippinarum]|uniref:secretin receptor-like n=1 Tax=Ruditapes philippinarum TaxID=129788 RepID=UPI00295B66D4|nr:secretin receptor-like [Ruditapes philippinarum]
MEYKIDKAAQTRANLSCLERIANYKPRQGYCNVTWDELLCWDATAAGRFARQKCPSYVSGISKTGFAFRECDKDGLWVHPFSETNESTGWTNYTYCFMEDPEYAAITHDLTRINLMSNVGYGISLVSLVIAVLIMCLSRRLHCKSNSLHINLFIAFILRAVLSLLKDVLFVSGLGLHKDVKQISHDKWEFIEEGMHWECKLIVSLFMYAVAASMMWIFMEGLYLHMLVYKTLFTERTGIRMYVVIGWLSPFVYIIPWIFVRIFADDTLCWNTDDFGYIWIIRSPIILTICINFVFFINIVRVLCLRMKNHRNVKGNNQQVRRLAKFSLVLIPLFGVLYIGTSAYPTGVDVKADMIYLYCEMFYNSFQGFLLAVLFCFLNEEVHNEIRRCWYRHRQQDNVFTRTFTLSSYRKGSCLSHSSSAQANIRGTKKLLSDRQFKDNMDETSKFTALNRGTASTSLNGSEYGRTNRYDMASDTDQIRPLMD